MTPGISQLRLPGILLVMLFHCPGVAAQDGFFSTIDVDVQGRGTNQSRFNIVGRLSEKVAYGLEDPDPIFSRDEAQLSSLETSLFLQADWQVQDNLNIRFSGEAFHDAIYSIDDSTDYSSRERGKFRNRFQVRDFYLESQVNDDLYIKIGNQILAWGYAEYLRVTDLINFEDQYTLGQQDLEDLRLQVPALLTSLSYGDWVFDWAVTYRAGRNWLSPAGDEFDQFIALRHSSGLLDRKTPENQLEYFFRASTRYGSGDIQLVAGEFNNNALSLGQIDRPRSITPIFEFGQQRVQAVGIAANYVTGPWLVFGELGIHANNPVLPELREALAMINGWPERDQVLGVLGTEYNGLRNTTISFELDSVSTRNHDASLLYDRDEISFGTRLHWTGQNERLQVIAVWNRLIDRQGYVSRVSANYDWSDTLDLGLLWVDYHAERNSLYYPYRNNDTVQLSIRFNFQN